MQNTFVLLADHAAVPPDGKLYVLGGGITSLGLPELPGRASFAAVAGFAFSGADVGMTHDIELRLVDADGGLLLPPGLMRFQIGEAAPAGVNTVSYFAPMFGVPGAYRVEYWSGGLLIAGVGFQVDVARQGERPPQPPGTPAAYEG